MTRALCGALASTALFAIAGPVTAPWSLAMLVALAPWLWAVRGARPLPVLLSSLLLAEGLVATCFGWLPATIASYTGLPLWACAALTALSAPLFLQPQLVLAAAARVLGGPMAFVLAYLAAEWALPKLFSDTIGCALYPFASLRQLAELAGPPALTLLCLVCAECVALVALRPAALSAALVAACTLWGSFRLQQIDARAAAAQAFTAGLVQAAIGSYDKLAAERGAYETVRKILDDHVALSQRLGPVDLLVWPETVYPTTFGAPKSEEGAAFDAEIAAFSQRTAPLVFGAFARGEGQLEHNAAFFLSSGATRKTDGWYAKSLLFPMTEEVPAWLDSPRARTLLPWLGHWQAGPGPRAVPLLLRDGRRLLAAPLICYEALRQGYLAAEARQGANVIVTLSNDGWFPDARAPRLHLLLAAFRSVETRLPQLRATNSGLSALVLPSGELVSPTGFGEQAAVRVRVPLVQPSWTPAKAWGAWLGPASLSGLGALLLLRLRRARRFAATGSAARPR